MDIDAGKFLKQVDEILARDDGPRVVHDFLDGLAGEMEKLCAAEQRLRSEIIDQLSDILRENVPEIILDAPGAESLDARLKKVGMNRSSGEKLPEEALELWERKTPHFFALIHKKRLTNSVINRVVERLYGISGIGD